MSLSHDDWDDATICDATEILDQAAYIAARAEVCPGCDAKAVLLDYDHDRRACATCLSRCAFCDEMGTTVVDAARVQSVNLITVDGAVCVCDHHYRTEVYAGSSEDLEHSLPRR